MIRQWPAERRIGIGMRLAQRLGKLENVLDGVHLRYAFFTLQHVFTPS